MIWAEGFGPDKVMEIPEYFVYCGIFITHRWPKEFAQIAKGEFLEMPYNLPSQTLRIMILQHPAVAFAPADGIIAGADQTPPFDF